LDKSEVVKNSIRQQVQCHKVINFGIKREIMYLGYQSMQKVKVSDRMTNGRKAIQ
jgi:hypothetical protein